MLSSDDVHVDVPELAVLAPGHVIRRERLHWQHGRGSYRIACSCGQYEEDLGRWLSYVEGAGGYAEAARLALKRHRRTIAGERGIYACGCTVAESKGEIGRFAPKDGERRQALRPSRVCPRHDQPYIPKGDRALWRPEMTASEVLDVLGQGYEQRAGANQEWVFLRELRVGTGAEQVEWDVDQGRHVKAGWGQYLDAFAINCWPSKGFRRVAFEVKVTRSDFLHELKHPDKRQPALRISNEFYFVCPKGLVSADETPPECGLIEVAPEGGRRKTVKAPHRDVEPLEMRTIVSLLRHAFNA
jgi:hypothetical protein